MHTKKMLTLEETKQKIAKGLHLFLAGDETLLQQLPRGNWAGGTIPYFIGDNGGEFCRNKLYVWEMPDFVVGTQVKTYDTYSLFNVYKEAPENGFSLIVLPASSPTHLSFALNATRYELFASRPLIGWISGVALEDLHTEIPRVYNGFSGEVLYDGAVVMHVTLPAGKAADMGIINIFEPGDGDTLVFLSDSFFVTDVVINGEKRSLADYIDEMHLDIKIPLVADYNGAKINISFQSIDRVTKLVTFYAPVFAGVEYKHAHPVADYMQAFLSHVSVGDYSRIYYSCNCILNYLYAGLEGKKTAEITGPITFGEVAYQLLNQTLVYIKIVDVNLVERLLGSVALNQRYRLLETLLSAIPDPVFYKDVKGRYMGCNSAFEKFMKTSRKDIIGNTAYSVVSKEIADIFTERDRQLLQNPPRQSYETRLQDGSGRMRSVIFHKATFNDGAGKVAGLIGVLTDVTDLRLAESTLEKTVKKLTAVLEQVKAIKGLIPICSQCKRIRTDNGSWQNLEAYFKDQSDSDFTHCICDKCLASEQEKGEQRREKQHPPDDKA
ncbi:MAG: PAS domain-containing protein [Elusimicrobia bacterium]|nr:PAS domain-containing protein [Elusimicrobiota bacterium]